VLQTRLETLRNRAGTTFRKPSHADQAGLTRPKVDRAMDGAASMINVPVLDVKARLIVGSPAEIERRVVRRLAEHLRRPSYDPILRGSAARDAPGSGLRESSRHRPRHSRAPGPASGMYDLNCANRDRPAGSTCRPAMSSPESFWQSA